MAVNRSNTSEIATSAYSRFLSLQGQSVFIGLVVVFSFVGSISTASNWAALAPEPGEALGLMWQVQAAFVSIGFAGLSIASQVFAEPPLVVGAARRAILDELRFGHLLLFGGIANGALGAVSIWFDTEANVIIAFVLILLPSVATMGAAYWMLAELFKEPASIERMAAEDLKLRIDAVQQFQTAHSNSLTLFEKRIAALDGVNNEDGPADPNSTVVRHSADRASIEDIDLAVVRSALQILRALEARQITLALSGAATNNFLSPVRISIHVAPGDRVRRGTRLFSVEGIEGLESLHGWHQEFARCRAVLLLSMKFADSTRPDPESRLLMEFSGLEDAVSDAIRAGLRSRVERGYELFETVLSHTSDKSKNGSSANSIGSRPWLERAVWESDEAAASAGVRVAMVASSAAMSRCMRAIELSDRQFFVSSLSSLSHIWAKSLEHHPESAAIFESLLVQIQNLAEIAVPASVLSDEQKDEFCRECVWTLVDMARRSMDLGRQGTLGRALGFLRNLFRYGNKSASTRAAVVGGQLVLLGWYLLQKDGPKHSDDELGRQLLPKVNRGLVLDGLQIVQSTDDAKARWHWWEMEDSLPFETGVLRISTYIDKAAALAIACGAGQLAPIRDLEGMFRHQRLAEQMSEIETAESLRPLVPQPTLLRDSKKLIDDRLHEWKVKQQVEVRATEIDAGKRAEFERGVASEFVGSGRLVNLVSADEISDAESEILGLDVLVPKSFFIDSHIYADPVSLGEQFARSIIQAEDGKVISVLRSVADYKICRLQELSDEVADRTSQMVDPVVLSVGSGQVLYQLADEQSQQNGQQLVKGTSIPLLEVFEPEGEDQQQVVIFDREESRMVARGTPPITNSSKVAGTDLYLTVRESDSADGEPCVRVILRESLVWQAPQGSSLVLNVTGTDW